MCGHHRSRVDGLDEWERSHLMQSSYSQLFDIFGREVVIEKEAFDGLRTLEEEAALQCWIFSAIDAMLASLLYCWTRQYCLTYLPSGRSRQSQTERPLRRRGSRKSFLPSCSTCSIVADHTLLQGGCNKTSSRTRFYKMQRLLNVVRWCDI